ncbi:MAG: hypothetical protein INR73_14360 [Williamsia sp.]|nr:hypothetical protein [Williamsia sp.]
MKSILPLLLSLVLFAGCKTTKTVATGPSGNGAVAAVTKTGFFDCFEEGLTASGQPVWCEASAILYDGNKFFLANDKDMPDQRSSVFYWTAKKGFADTSRSAVYLNSPVFKQAKKFEDFALTPDGRIVFLSTAFDRVKPGATDWNGYNTILYWQAGNENDPRVLSANHTDSTSVFLRDKISKVLTSPLFPQGMPYFKIEGLAATNDRLYFGIREEGKKFDEFSYKVKIVSVGWHVANGFIELGDDYKVLIDFNVTAASPALKQPVGLSSIEYDQFNNRFLILTSHENGENLDAYLWTATPSDLEKGTLTLVKDASGNPLHFSHKGEDIAVVSKNRVVIIHDDDRVKSQVNGQTRQPNQAAYSVVEFR